MPCLESSGIPVIILVKDDDLTGLSFKKVSNTRTNLVFKHSQKLQKCYDCDGDGQQVFLSNQGFEIEILTEGLEFFIQSSIIDMIVIRAVMFKVFARRQSEHVMPLNYSKITIHRAMLYSDLNLVQYNDDFYLSDSD